MAKRKAIEYVLVGTLMLSTSGYELITQFEGKRNVGYKDIVGVETICYGHTRTAREGAYLSDKECDALLIEDTTLMGKEMSACITAPISQMQYDALLSFTYNIGSPSFCKSTLVRKLNNRDYCGASNEFNRWAYAGGKWVYGLDRRRSAEKAIFLEGTKENCNED